MERFIEQLPRGREGREDGNVNGFYSLNLEGSFIAFLRDPCASLRSAYFWSRFQGFCFGLFVLGPS
jgi:hypothetical protein